MYEWKLIQNIVPLNVKNNVWKQNVIYMYIVFKFLSINRKW